MNSPSDIPLTVLRALVNRDDAVVQEYTTTKNGRTINGRRVEDTATRVKLLTAGSKEEIIARSDITSLRVSELSVMPEGLEQMPDADFRNLIQFILNPTPAK